MIFVGVGANLPSRAYGPPRATCGAALAALSDAGVKVVQRSRWYRTAPVPVSEQPWFVNGVARVETRLKPLGLMGVLLDIEVRFGRRRGASNAPRVLDLDLLAFDDLTTGTGGAVSVPHPRLHERAFVLLPLRELSPEWRHPVSGLALSDLIAALPPEQIAEPMEDGPGAFGTEWCRPG